MGFFTASTLFARATALLFLPRVADCRLENGITLKEYFKDLQDDNLSYLEAQSDIIDTLVIGSIANYLSVDEYDDLMGLVMESYGEELVFENEIGRSFLNQKIKVYTVMTGASKESFRDEIVDRNSMLLNGAHHAREVTTISQTLTQFLSLLYSFETGDTEVVDLLEKAAIVFLPIINIDSVALIGNIYEDLDELSLIRKNRKIDSRSRSCASTDYGVDLNRNYSFKFAYDSIGSSGSPCEFDYRGTEAFSEPETQAIRRFLQLLPNMKIALNFHSWGPLFIYPFQFDSSSNKLLREDFAKAEQFYLKLIADVELPSYYKSGNAMQTIKYRANGEASDWMLGELGIYAVSVELGGLTKATSSFFIEKASDLKELLIENSPWISKTMLQIAKEEVSCSQKGASEVVAVADDAVKVLTSFTCTNSGLYRARKAIYGLARSSQVSEIGTAELVVNEGSDTAELDCESEAGQCLFEMPEIPGEETASVDIISEHPPTFFSNGQSPTESIYQLTYFHKSEEPDTETRTEEEVETDESTSETDDTQQTEQEAETSTEDDKEVASLDLQMADAMRATPYTRTEPESDFIVTGVILGSLLLCVIIGFGFTVVLYLRQYSSGEDRGKVEDSHDEDGSENNLPSPALPNRPEEQEQARLESLQPEQLLDPSKPLQKPSALLDAQNNNGPVFLATHATEQTNRMEPYLEGHQDKQLDKDVKL